MDQSLYLDIMNLSWSEILQAACNRCSISYVARTSKALIVNELIQSASPALLSEIRDLAQHKVEQGPLLRKRRFLGEEVERRNRLRLMDHEDEEENTREDCFMTLPSEKQRHDRYQAFYDAMKPSAVQVKVCAVCARECGVMDEKVTIIKFHAIPNRQRLHPIVPHVAHDLYEGLQFSMRELRLNADQRNRMST